jgi:hypothetical protein
VPIRAGHRRSTPNSPRSSGSGVTDPRRSARTAPSTGTERCISSHASLIRAFWSDARIADVLLDQQNGISAHVLDQDDPVRAAWRAIENAHEELAGEAASGRERAERQQRQDGAGYTRTGTTNAASLAGKPVPKQRCCPSGYRCAG